MNYQKWLPLLVLTGMMWYGVSCGAPAAAPVAEAPTTTARPAATVTPVPPINTPVPTATSVLPTNTPAPTATLEVSAKILFIGDSLTYWNNGLDQNIEQLASSANPPLVIEADSAAMAYGSLEKMWKEIDAAEVIGVGGYDVVVLQDYLQATDVDTFYEYARKFDAEIKKAGAETMLFMAWQVSYLELTIEEIAQAHRDIAAELGADVAPVGLAFQRAQEERPELKLVGPDGIHPSIHGTYLATNVVYATIFGQSPNSTTYLPAAPSHDCAAEEEEEESHDPALDAYFTGRSSGCVTEEEAAFLQRIAWETVQEYTAEAAPVAETPTSQGTVELIREKITSQALAGNLLDDPAERTVYVVLPSGYASSEQRYPVVYVLPWANGNPSDNAVGFKQAMNSHDGQIEEMIVVVPDAASKLGNSYFMSSSTIGDHETYLTQEVVNYVDTHYRTLPTRDSRGLAGCSAGGEAAMRLALKYPNVFSVVAATGGAYDYSWRRGRRT